MKRKLKSKISCQGSFNNLTMKYDDFVYIKIINLCMWCMDSLAGLTRLSSLREVPCPPNQNPNGRSELSWKQDLLFIAKGVLNIRHYRKFAYFSIITHLKKFTTICLCGIYSLTWEDYLDRPPLLLSVISCTIGSALLCIMVARNRITIWPPPPQLSLHRRAALTVNSNGTRSAQKGKRRVAV
jgi:hypothetical protein